MRSSGIAIGVMVLAATACEAVLDLHRPIAVSDDASTEPGDTGSQGVPEAAANGGEASPPDAPGDSVDAEAGSQAGPEAGFDSGGVVGAKDATLDSTLDDAGSDAAPPLYFGTDCPAGTVYTDPFDFDPVASGNWTLVAGTYLFDATKHTVTLVADGSNTQMWIGPRPAWTNYTVSSSVTLNSTNGNGGINFRVEDSPDPAPNDSGHMYLFGMWTTGTELGVETGGDASAWKYLAGTSSASFNAMTSYVMQASITGQIATGSLDGTALFTYTDTTYNLMHGSIGLKAYKSTLTFGPVTVTCN
jgi:hypothetical protein